MREKQLKSCQNMIILPKPSWKIRHRRTRFHWLMKKLSPTSKNKKQSFVQPVSLISPFQCWSCSTQQCWSCSNTHAAPSPAQPFQQFLILTHSTPFATRPTTKVTKATSFSLFRLAFQVRVNCNPPWYWNPKETPRPLILAHGGIYNLKPQRRIYIVYDKITLNSETPLMFIFIMMIIWISFFFFE